MISWNLNGLRSTWKKGDLNWLIEKSPDIICLQETKVEEIQIPEDLNTAFADYYKVYSSSQLRKGYSGVAIFSKTIPDKITGLGIKE